MSSVDDEENDGDADQEPLIEYCRQLNKRGHRVGYVTFILSVLLLAGVYSLISFNRSAPRIAEPSSFNRTILDDGWIRYESKTEPRFSISLPANWNLDSTTISSEAMAKQVEETDPQFSKGLREIGDEPPPLFHAIHLEPPSVSTIGISLDRLSDYPQYPDFLSYVEAQAAMVTEFMVQSEPISHSRRQVADLKAEVLKLNRVQLLPGDYKLLQTITQYYFIKDQEIIVITFGSSSETTAFIDEQAATLDRIAVSFEWS